MRIGIDAHILGKGKGGVETALLGIVTALAEIDRENDYFIYVGRSHPFQKTPLPANFHLRRLPFTNPLIERPFVIPFYYRKDRLDLIHLQRIAPPWGCRNCVLHVHDILYETHPQFFSPVKRRLFNVLSRASVSRASHVVTVTESARRDIQRVYDVAAERITVISNGVDESLFRGGLDSQSIETAKARFGVSGPYVLLLGMLERHKNTHVAIEAFERFAEAQPDYSLVIVGQARSETRKGYAAELFQTVSRMKSRERIVFTGYVSDADRLSLLNGAATLVFPGAAEGFGLPPLEAMACGVPVVMAESDVAREVCGDAAMMTPAGNAGAVALAMLRLTTDAALRTNLIARGLHRAATFRWQSVAARLLQVYVNVGSAAGTHAFERRSNRRL